MREKRKEALFAVAFVLTAAVLIHLVSGALRPLRTAYGAVWDPYLAEPEDTLDYLYLGSSYAYCDVNPGLVYDASGLTGYVLAGPEQTFSIADWYLREALKRQSPQLVLIEATGLHFRRYQSYTQVNVGYMPCSENKLGAIFQAAEPELRTGLLFDLYFYHSRWKEVSPLEAARALRPQGTDRRKGFTEVEGVSPAMPGEFDQRYPVAEEVYQANLADLGELLSICRQAGARPVVVFHPTLQPFAPEVRARIRADVAALEPEAVFLDWSDDAAALGLDPDRHFFDPGHLNQEGAAIFSAWLGAFLTDSLAAVPRPQTERNAAAWRETAAFWRDPPSVSAEVPS